MTLMSTEAELKQGEAGRIELSGELGFNNVTELELQGRQLVDRAASSPVTVDLAGVTAVSSAGLALLISWLRYARQQGAALSFVSVPENLLGLARVSGLDHLLLKQSA